MAIEAPGAAFITKNEALGLGIYIEEKSPHHQQTNSLTLTLKQTLTLNTMLPPPPLIDTAAATEDLSTHSCVLHLCSTAIKKLVLIGLSLSFYHCQRPDFLRNYY